MKVNHGKKSYAISFQKSVSRAKIFTISSVAVRKKDIEVVYTPEKKVKLKFRMEGQQRFVRADTLGEDYLPEKIIENIDLLKQARLKIA